MLRAKQRSRSVSVGIRQNPFRACLCNALSVALAAFGRREPHARNCRNKRPLDERAYVHVIVIRETYV
jgi:hypothetical protein